MSAPVFKAAAIPLPLSPSPLQIGSMTGMAAGAAAGVVGKETAAAAAVVAVGGGHIKEVSSRDRLSLLAAGPESSLVSEFDQQAYASSSASSPFPYGLHSSTTTITPAGEHGGPMSQFLSPDSDLERSKTIR